MSCIPRPSTTQATSRLAAGLAPAAFLLLSGCSTLNSLNPFGGSSEAPITVQGSQSPQTLYSNGIDALHTGRYRLAQAQFEAIQQNFPYSAWTSNAQLMEGYAYYLQNSYPDAVAQLDRFLQLHPTSKDAAYAYYLRALCYYEQIADVSRDQQGTVEAMAALQEVATRFPDSAYARDARLKIDLCRDHIAGKEMLVGRYYEKQHYYEAAINRYQRVVQDFQTTNHTAEALSRLVELDLKLGLTDQARRTASVLGYNYPGSPWYETSYRELRNAKALDPNMPQPGSSGPVPATVGPAAPSTTASAHPGFLSRAWNSVF